MFFLKFDFFKVSTMAYALQTSSSESISQFIATQGPLPHTVEDFWEMVIQQHCPIIVMLTRLVDNYKVFGCINYKVSLILFRACVCYLICWMIDELVLKS